MLISHRSRGHENREKSTRKVLAESGPGRGALLHGLQTAAFLVCLAWRMVGLGSGERDRGLFFLPTGTLIPHGAPFS